MVESEARRSPDSVNRCWGNKFQINPINFIEIPQKIKANSIESSTIYGHSVKIYRKHIDGLFSSIEKIPAKCFVASYQNLWKSTQSQLKINTISSKSDNYKLIFWKKKRNVIFHIKKTLINSFLSEKWLWITRFIISTPLRLSPRQRNTYLLCPVLPCPVLPCPPSQIQPLCQETFTYQSPNSHLSNKSKGRRVVSPWTSSTQGHRIEALTEAKLSALTYSTKLTLAIETQ